MEIFRNYTDEMHGFKLSDHHFLLGSKIHIRDFYFAKRLFQNSYYASKYAFLIAKYIYETHNTNKTNIIKKGLTLVGYGLYSELLVSLVEKYLKKIWNEEIKINHNLIQDSEDLMIVKAYEQFYSNIIIIVPIVSTFSTSIKIEEIIKKKHPDRKDIEILRPHINVILVHNNKLHEKYLDGDIEFNFGWERWCPKHKIISVNAFYESDKNRIKEQKYFLSLSTVWELSENCNMCFKDKKPLLEEYLNITDKTSVTPLLVYGLPKGRKILDSDLVCNYSLDSDMLSYKHYDRSKNHYNYYIQIEKFFINNKGKISTWLDELKKKIKFNSTENIILITPGHFSNAGFVTLVNEVLFSNLANIIHYDISNEHIQNFELFYKKDIEKADKIFFVDDIITSGHTFTKANYFIKHIREEIRNDHHPGFNACIILLDRSSYFVNKNILRKIFDDKYDGQDDINHPEYSNNKIFAFANIHLPSIINSDDTCPLCLEQERYNNLVKDSFLDKLKVFFLNKSKKLEKKEITSTDDLSNKFINIYDKDKYKYILRVKAIHMIYQWFTDAKNIFNPNDFEAWLKQMVTQIKDKSFEMDLKNEYKPGILSLTHATVIKVLLQPPFNKYQPFRKAAFTWVINLLDMKRKELVKKILDNDLDYNTFRDFKFLSRRASILNANYLISVPYFDSLELLFTNDGLLGLQKERENHINSLPSSAENDIFIEKEKDEYKNLKDFPIYYVALVKELLFLNESRCIKLEERISYYENKTDNTDEFIQLLRMLREENGIFIKHYWEMIRSNDSWDKQKIMTDYSTKEISKILSSISVQEFYKTKTLINYLNYSKDALTQDISFKNYLWLMNFFDVDKLERSNQESGNNTDIEIPSLSDKTDYIVDKLKEILAGDILQHDKIGAFFIVNYNPVSKNPYFLAYNQGNLSWELNNCLKDMNKNYIGNFINGIKDGSEQEYSNKTIIEFNLADNIWHDLYDNNNKLEEIGISKESFSSDFNRILLIRINKKYYEKDKDTLIDKNQGVIGFYFKTTKSTITNIIKSRYLLLLRSEISEFIERHHKNDEFKDWVVEHNRQKTALLTGHGREMLIRIAQKYQQPFTDIISKILLVQRLIIDSEDERIINIRNPKELSEVGKMFRGLFKTETEYIRNDYFIELGKMVKLLYQIPEIENSEEIYDPVLDLDNSLSFHFPKEILNMLCFEFFVNAKKNRWNFTAGEKITVGKKIFEKNEISIKAHVINDELILSIINTGPKVEDSTCIEPGNVKKDDISSGLRLIKTILDDFQLGSFQLNSDPLVDEFHKITITLKLKPWM